MNKFQFPIEVESVPAVESAEPVSIDFTKESPALEYDSLLPFVNKPSRYIGGEWNSVRKPEAFRKNAVGVCLCFPDLYETGFANMGVEILYRVINGRQDAFAERLYAVDEDMALLLRKARWPIFSLENHSPISSFDIVGFSLPYELCFNNVLEMLDLGGIPIHAADRDETYPLVVGGGPSVVNPEPMADFFDAFVIGDGEEIIGEMIEAVREFKRSGGKKIELLRRLARIPGLYVPALYDISYNEDGTVRAVSPKFPEVPAKVVYRQTAIGKFMNGEFSFPIRPVVPFVQTVHDRLNVEIQRGCPWRCRFCQAGFTYHSYRERSKEELVQIIEEGLKNTGYDAVTLAGLSAADHREIVPLLQALSERFTKERVSIGLPSTRADRFTLACAEILQVVRRQSLTFAPEAGTERMRRVIRKELQETEIRATLRMAAQNGWKNVKLYFMYGLPTETQEDLQGVVDLLRHSRREQPQLSVACTLSPFVPKPHTPFQWRAQDTIEVLKEKLGFFRKVMPAQIRAHGLEQIVVEGVLSRGDRRCSQLIEKTWRDGAKFDEWSERFRYDRWRKAFTETGLTPEFFCYRERGENEVFPWDHLQGGPDRKALWNDYQTSLRQAAEPLPQEPHLKIRPEVPPLSPESLRRAQTFPQETLQKLRFRIARKGMVRHLSHLEQIEMIRRLLRRAQLPLTYSSGFHPQLKCSFGPAISVGYESECEYFDLDLSQRLELDDVETRIRKNLPEGFSLVKVSRIPIFFPSLEALLNRVDYDVRVPQGLLKNLSAGSLAESLKEFLSLPQLSLEKTKKTQRGTVTKTIQLKPLILKMDWEQNSLDSQGPAKLQFSLRFGPGQNVKPEKIAAKYLNLTDDEVRLLSVNRRAFYMERPDGTWLEP